MEAPARVIQQTFHQPTNQPTKPAHTMFLFVSIHTLGGLRLSVMSLYFVRTRIIMAVTGTAPVSRDHKPTVEVNPALGGNRAGDWKKVII
jgi:hypothetical protein